MNVNDDGSQQPLVMAQISFVGVLSRIKTRSSA